MSTIRQVDAQGNLASDTIEPKAEASTPINTSDEQTHVSAPVFPELAEKAIHQAFGLENDSEKHQYQDKVDTLMEYIKTRVPDIKNIERIMSEIRDLELKLGSPPISEKRINYVARYAYLLMDEAKVKNERKKMEDSWRM